MSLLKEAEQLCLKAYQSINPGRSIEDIYWDVQGFWEFQDYNLWIVFRGSSSRRDWLINLSASKLIYPYGDGNSKVKIHSGFCKAYLSVRKEIHNLVRLWAGTHDIIFTGHSLGGAIATIAAVDCEYNFNINPKLITFAQPKVGNRAYAESIDRRVPDYQRLCNVYDPVPHLPWGRYCHGGKLSHIARFCPNPHEIKGYNQICP